MVPSCEYFLEFPHFFSFVFTEVALSSWLQAILEGIAHSSTIMIFHHSWYGSATTLYNFWNLRPNMHGIWIYKYGAGGNEPRITSSQGLDPCALSGIHSFHANPSHMEMHLWASKPKSFEYQYQMAFSWTKAWETEIPAPVKSIFKCRK